MKLSVRHSQILALLVAFGPMHALAQENDASFDTRFDNCLLREIHMDVEHDNLDEIKAQCLNEVQASTEHVSPTRHSLEKETENNPFVITPYRQNYILPITEMSQVNTAPYTSDIFEGKSDELKDEEIKFQISFKMPLVEDGIFNEEDQIYFGFTLKSFWQAYSSEISAPFRETNYRPEIFYESPLPIDSSEGVWFTRVGFEHESNGRTQELSRSWNRIYGGIGYAEDDLMVYLEPWYRIPDSDDDNPDIEDYMGHFELTAAYKYQAVEFSGVARYNFRTGYGGFEAGMSFPLIGRVRGYVQYYQGYGESLIDYNYNNKRIGVGVLLTDIL
ncbi:phospholipase A [Vibrio barjaei]|uniref:phospholipase A n=1 Tax=Vibrio barjaei TaxID=1676683 RepID=UPI0007BAFB87|nr:phospholipase A [Vibrio barjaei]OIN27345.1 phospholipase [Vibrio barjaei]